MYNLSCESGVISLVSEKKKISNARWDAENMTNLAVRVRRTYADRVRAKAASEGKTVGSILRAALDDFLADDGKTE